LLTWLRDVAPALVLEIIPFLSKSSFLTWLRDVTALVVEIIPYLSNSAFLTWLRDVTALVFAADFAPGAAIGMGALVLSESSR
jgi:hypothetical protein